MTTERYSNWSVTINNPTPDDEECIALARQRGWQVEGQLEKGAEGTPHYQLMVRTGQVRFSAVKKAFPRAHIEAARNAAALKQYVHKEATREAELSTTSEKYPSLSKLWDLVFAYMDENNWVNQLVMEFGCITHYNGKTRELWWKDAPTKDCLTNFDWACMALIDKGYHIETHAVNPQVRACFTKFWPAMYRRSIADRQTGRQLVSSAEEIILPTIINHAVDEEEEVNSSSSSPTASSCASSL